MLFNASYGCCTNFLFYFSGIELSSYIRMIAKEITFHTDQMTKWSSTVIKIHVFYSTLYTPWYGKA